MSLEESRSFFFISSIMGVLFLFISSIFKIYEFRMHNASLHLLKPALLFQWTVGINSIDIDYKLSCDVKNAIM